jgi:peptide/nickel transport system substrate-binding protein
MREKLKRPKLFAKIFLLSLLLSFIAAFAVDYNPNGRLIDSLGGEPSVLNPILSTDSSSSAVEGALFNGLIKFNAKLDPVPDLCERWTVSPDGKTWDFYLRKGVRWHDGQAFTSADVVFTFHSILNSKVNSVRRSDYIINGSPVQFFAVNKYQVRAILPEPFAPFLVHMGMGIIPHHIYEYRSINNNPANRKPIGTGPFKFKEWVSGDHITVVRNDKYHFGRPLLKEIVFKIIPDENSALVALQAKELDMSGIPSKDYLRMKKVKGINVYEYQTLLYTYLGFNLDSPLFCNREVRQALAYAVNRDQIINLIFRGHAKPAFAPSSPVSWAYSNQVEKYPYNPAKAQEILAKAGWNLGPDGVLVNSKKTMVGSKSVKLEPMRFEFTVLANQGNKDREKAATILQQQFSKIGVKMNIRVVEWSALIKIINSQKTHKDFDAVIIGWALGLDPDAYSIWHSSQFPNGFNFIHYNNKKVDQLLEAGRVTLDRAKRKTIYASLWQEICRDQPYIFLWYPNSIVGVSARVGGLSLPPGPAGIVVDLEKVYVRGK